MEEGIDFYYNEDGLMVLTAAYLLERGYCCQNRCTNCPWNYGKDDSQNTAEPSTKKPYLNDANTEGDQDYKV